jgi:hypothetical protein
MGQQKTFISYVITAQGGAITRPVTENCDGYNVTATGGAVTLIGDMTFAHSGSPVLNQVVVVNFGGGVTIDGNILSFFGFTLDQYQALLPSIITGTWNGASWDIFISINNKPIVQYSVDGSVIIPLSIPGTAMANATIPVSKLENVGDAKILQGNGSTVVANTLNGDGTITNTGTLTIANDVITTVKILDANVTVLKLTTELRTELLVVPVSFESGEQGAYKIKMQYSGSFLDVYAEAVKAIAGTDTATIILKNNAGTTMTVTTPIVFAISDAFGTAYDSAITGNNTFVAGDIITVNTAKTTPGGKALVTLKILRS